MTEYLPAPADLPEREATKWAAVVHSRPIGYFTVLHADLIRIYVSAVCTLLDLRKLEQRKIDKQGDDWFLTEEADLVGLRRISLAGVIEQYTHLLGLSPALGTSLLDYNKLRRDFTSEHTSPEPIN
ncbi:hypothetical protein [Ruegeria arenilitoris]|uniref:hypothetical protein n=1 Tax=Ruegeria arenilitoris TaxID=1173585 RepID=UPI00147EAEAD|nr:hypothetical protein [Ruegeria arenilitoris]